MRHKRILYIQYTNPALYPPLEHSSRVLAKAGWDVLFLGTGAMGSAAGLRFPPHARITVRQMPFCHPGWLQKLHYACYMGWVLAWRLSWRPDWVYASDMLSCPVAFLCSLSKRARVLYHEHDSPGVAGGGWVQRIYRAARLRLARQAKLCVLPSHERARRFQLETAIERPPMCVWNCPGIDEAHPARATAPSSTLQLIYFGSIVPNRLPLTVLDAMVCLPPKVTLRVAGYETVGHPGYMAQFLHTAEALGLGGRVEYLGTLPHRQELLDLCRECHVGLSLMPLQSSDINLETMAGASNKPFDYLACGLALLVTDLPTWRDLYVDSGCAKACDPSEASSIAAALRWFLEQPEERQVMGQRGRLRILDEWNYEMQFAPVLSALESGVRRGSTPLPRNW